MSADVTSSSATSASALVTSEHSADLRRRARRRGRLGSVAYHLVMLAICVVVLYPAAWMFASSLKPSSEIIGNVSLIPENGSFDNFITAMAGIGGVSTLTFFKNSLIVAVFSVVGTALSAAITAYAFARISFRGKAMWFSLMVATLLVPFHVIIIPQYILFQQLGLVNTFGALLIPRFLATEAFFVFLMVQFMRGLPRELDEAARIDGAGHLRIFVSIILPLLRPAIVTTSILTFIGAWNDFLGPLLYLKRPDLATLPVALRLFVDQTSTSDYGAQVAMAVLALLPVILFFFIFQRYLIDGVATQGLKG